MEKINDNINIQSLLSDVIGNNVIFTLWTGLNELNNNRLTGLNALKTKSECIVINVNPTNMNQFIKAGFSIHESYESLSLIHKADYMRCYLMHHYGGGYSDIKATTGSWVNAFNKLKQNENTWIVGFDVDGIAYPDENTQEENNLLGINFNNLIGVGFLFVNHTRY